MQSHPTTLFMVAHTVSAQRQREAEAVRLGDVAAAGVSVPRLSLRGWLASRLRDTADRLQPAGAELTAYAYR
jgi:hypothetical protein